MKPTLNFFTKLQDILLPLTLLTVFITGILINAPLKEAFEYSPEEGNNLMKSSLFLKGFSLYKQTWADQPPLFTLILSYWFKLFKPSVYYGRILVLIFSGIFLWAFYQTIKSLWGHFCASLGVLFLILSQYYIRQSISITIELPTLTFAMLSIYYTTLYRSLQLKRFLVLSGVFMALALQTKLSSLFLIPVIAFEIVRAKWLKGLLLWLGAFLVVYLSITVIFFHFNFYMFIQQLIKPHYFARSVFTLSKDSFLVILRAMFGDFDIVLLAMTCVVLLIRQKKWQSPFPVLWLIVAFAILLTHRPVRQYYYLFISIPLCWLAAISFSEFFKVSIHQGRFTRKSFFQWLTAGLIILTILRIPIKYNRICKSVEEKTTTEEQTVLKLLSKYKKDTHWIFTDRPIFAFYANMLVPPEIAVMSFKRILTGNMPPDYVLSILQKYKPEQILLARFKDYDPKVILYIERNYFKIYNRIPVYNIWIPKAIRWHPKGIRFANRVWFYKLPIVRGGHFYPISDTEIKLYIRKDVMERNRDTGVP